MADTAYERLLAELREVGYLRDPRLMAAFRRVRRENFLPPGMELQAPINAPLPLAGGQTISQPLTVALMLELLAPRFGHQVLDIGSGSGWSTALISELVGPTGHVYAIERIRELHRFGQANVARQGCTNVTMVCADGTRGFPRYAPFDRIQVAAAAATVPEALLQQLAVGGRMVIPTQAEDLRLIVRKTKDEYDTKIFPGFLFVPLIEDREA